MREEGTLEGARESLSVEKTGLDGGDQDEELELVLRLELRWWLEEVPGRRKWEEELLLLWKGVVTERKAVETVRWMLPPLVFGLVRLPCFLGFSSSSSSSSRGYCCPSMTKARFELHISRPESRLYLLNEKSLLARSCILKWNS